MPPGNLTDQWPCDTIKWYRRRPGTRLGRFRGSGPWHVVPGRSHVFRPCGAIRQLLHRLAQCRSHGVTWRRVCPTSGHGPGVLPQVP